MTEQNGAQIFHLHEFHRDKAQFRTAHRKNKNRFQKTLMTCRPDGSTQQLLKSQTGVARMVNHHRKTRMGVLDESTLLLADAPPLSRNALEAEKLGE